MYIAAMIRLHSRLRTAAWLLALGLALGGQAASEASQATGQDQPPDRGDAPPPEGGPDFGGPDFNGPPPFGPPPFGPDDTGPGDFMPGGPGFGGPDAGRSGARGPGGFGGPGPGGGGPGSEPDLALVKQFDQDLDGRLDNAERKAARQYLSENRGNRRPGGPGGPGGRRGGFRGPRGNPTAAQPGPKLSPADVPSYPDAPLYASNVLRTLFLEFENADWEAELADFKDTDVEVPAKLTVDGRAYPDVGVHFRGMSSYIMIGEGQKRSLNLSLDFVHVDQRLGGYRTLNLLNAHEDPTFLRAVLFSHVASHYLAVPKVNLVRVVINGESWGVYINLQQFNKEFLEDWYGTTRGARWKVPGSPGGRGGLEYLGDDAAPYRRIYQLKTKEDPRSWVALILLCQVLNQAPPDQLEVALAPLLDIEGALKFLALENVMVNADGYWVRRSDYGLYRHPDGRFRVIPMDINETFSAGGGPGGPRGPGGPGAPGGPGGFRPGGGGPVVLLATQIWNQGNKNGDTNLTSDEFLALADAWFDQWDPDRTDKLELEPFTARLAELLPLPGGRAGRGPRDNVAPEDARRSNLPRGGFGPANFLAEPLFIAFDGNQDRTVSRAELRDVFKRWFTEWDKAKAAALSEEQLREGLAATLPRPSFGGPGRRGGPGGFGGPPGFAGPGGFGGPGGGRGPGGPGGGGVELDPLVAANDAGKPLLSKLLAVPALRARYLGYVREIAETWLDWNRLGPVVDHYQALIAEDVKKDTRKLDSTEEFLAGVAASAEPDSASAATRSGPGGQRASLRSFCEKRRAYLLAHPEVQRATLAAATR